MPKNTQIMEDIFMELIKAGRFQLTIVSLLSLNYQRKIGKFF